jgi:hypothetical protein
MPGVFCLRYFFKSKNGPRSLRSLGPLYTGLVCEIGTDKAVKRCGRTLYTGLVCEIGTDKAVKRCGRTLYTGLVCEIGTDKAVKRCGRTLNKVQKLLLF